MSLHDKLMEDAEYQRLYAQEGLILHTTDLIDRWLSIKKISRSELAKKVGKDRSFISQLLNGTRNMTLRTLADMCWALGLEIRFVAKEKSPTHLNNEVIAPSSEQPLRPATNFEMAANDFDYAEAA